MHRLFFSRHFKHQIKPLIKKFPSLLDDIIQTLNAFDRHTGISLGANTYKIRIQSRDLPKGKSNSFRMIILLVEFNAIIAPLTIYFKSDKADITKKEIVFHANRIRQELDIAV